MDYRFVDASRAEDIAKLAVCLTQEIIERTAVEHFDLDVSLAVQLSKPYLCERHYHVVGAFDNEDIIGFGALCESRSLYAQGVFGIVQEFYVLPEYRSQRIGKHLLAKFVEFAPSQHSQMLRSAVRSRLAQPLLPLKTAA